MVATSTAKPAKKSAVLRQPPDGFLSRIQAQDLLGVSNATLMDWERRGLLHPVRALSRTSNHKCFYYDATELATLPMAKREKYRPGPGEIAGRVFEMLRAGKTIADIVIELRVEPAAVEDLRQQWLESVSTKVLVVSERDRAELERLLGGEIRSSGQLVALARRRVVTNATTREEGARSP
jgi:hypothetical protein